MQAPPARLNTEQRRRLKALGVVDPQIKALQRVLQMAGQHARPLPSSANVKEVLDDLSSAISNCQKAIGKVMALPSKPEMQHVLEAYELIAFGTHTPTSDGQELDRAIKALEELREVVDGAKSNQRKKQSRPRSDSFVPVQMIHRALVTGWEKSHGDTHEVPAMLKPSRTESSAFRQVVQVCYEAMTGDVDVNPDAAIRAYLSWIAGTEKT